MIWQKLGLVWTAGGVETAGFTHAMAPTPVLISDEVIRLYLTVRDSRGRGHVRYVDVSSRDPRRLLNVAAHAVLGPGETGRFDDNGVVPMSLLRLPDGRFFLYYSGFQLGTNVPYRIFSGLAVSRDGGRRFERYHAEPILGASKAESCFRCATFTILDGTRFRLWYIAGNDWITIQGKQVPVYALRYAESPDGIHWPERGHVSLTLTDPDEHGFGRPWVIQRGTHDYELFYSIRRKSLAAYRLGYATSRNGIEWVRKDSEMGLDVTPGGFDGNAISYSAVIEAHGRTFCFYNGDDFGKAGFAVAERMG